MQKDRDRCLRYHCLDHSDNVRFRASYFGPRMYSHQQTFIKVGIIVSEQNRYHHTYISSELRECKTVPYWYHTFCVYKVETIVVAPSLWILKIDNMICTSMKLTMTMLNATCSTYVIIPDILRVLAAYRRGDWKHIWHVKSYQSKLSVDSRHIRW